MKERVSKEEYLKQIKEAKEKTKRARKLIEKLKRL